MDKEFISGLKREDFQAVVQGKQTDLYTLTNSNGMVLLWPSWFLTRKARWLILYKVMTA